MIYSTISTSFQSPQGGIVKALHGCSRKFGCCRFVRLSSSSIKFVYPHLPFKFLIGGKHCLVSFLHCFKEELASFVFFILNLKSFNSALIKQLLLFNKSKIEAKQSKTQQIEAKQSKVKQSKARHSKAKSNTAQHSTAKPRKDKPHGANFFCLFPD